MLRITHKKPLNNIPLKCITKFLPIDLWDIQTINSFIIWLFWIIMSKTYSRGSRTYYIALKEILCIWWKTSENTSTDFKTFNFVINVLLPLYFYFIQIQLLKKYVSKFITPK